MQLYLANTLVEAATTQDVLDMISEDVYAVCDGRPIRAGFSCEEFGLVPESKLELLPKLLGGKVHGSLARAGKVKGQTPKVDKQDTKKAKTGRAKRRMQVRHPLLFQLECTREHLRNNEIHVLCISFVRKYSLKRFVRYSVPNAYRTKRSLLNTLLRDSVLTVFRFSITVDSLTSFHHSARRRDQTPTPNYCSDRFSQIKRQNFSTQRLLSLSL